MLYSVYVLKADGSFELVRADIDGDRADSIARHPSLAGRAVVVPAFQGLVLN